MLGQEQDLTAHIRSAQHCLQLVGSSESECDTIPGRQCMAMSFMLAEKFEDALIFLDSIETFSQNDDHFYWNKGICLASLQKYHEAEVMFESIRNENYKFIFLL